MSAGRDFVATMALAAYSLAATAVLVRIFEDASFVSDVVVLVLGGHLFSFGLRRARLPVWAAVPVLAAMLTAMLAAFYYSDTLNALALPGRETWQAFRIDTTIVRDLFPTATAPVPYEAGWAALAGIGVAAVVLVSDTFAFRADARAESLVPGGVLFVFLSALGDGGGGIALAALLVAMGVLAVVVLRWRQPRDPAVIRSSLRPTRPLVAPAAFSLALVVALVAAAVGPRLPGATAEPLLDTRGRSGGVTEVVSPLVDIRARLVDLSETEVFTVSATSESYWRVTTLPEFDGDTFRLPTRPLERVDGGLGASRAGALEIRQEIAISALGGQLVPAAAEPIEASGPDLRWNPDTSTLVRVGGPVERGDRYVVVSSSPRFQPSELRASGSSGVADLIHLELPDDLPPIVGDTARLVAGGAPSTYDAALALQSWFRTEFTYSLEVPAGHGTSAIESFLIQRIGYCEQFSATFAAMARTLGIPSRVAVGYTAGVRGDDGTYSVRGRHAHAWPELWFDGIGWVPFEPTPGRGAPGTEQYTGVAPEQDTTPDEVTNEFDETETTTPEVEPGGQPDPADLIPDFADPGAGQSTGTPPAPTTEPAGGVAWGPLLVAGAIALLLVAPALVRRVRRRLDDRIPAADRVALAWKRATRAARCAGVSAGPSATTLEWAAATAAALPVAARPMRSLAETVEAVAFAPPGTVDLESVGPLGTNLARECTAWSRQIDALAREQLDLRNRVIGYFVWW